MAEATYQELVGLLNDLTQRLVRLQSEVYDLSATVQHIDLHSIHNRLHQHGTMLLQFNEAQNRMEKYLLVSQRVEKKKLKKGKRKKK
jgi:hypothetical protein